MAGPASTLQVSSRPIDAELNRAAGTDLALADWAQCPAPRSPRPKIFTPLQARNEQRVRWNQGRNANWVGVEPALVPDACGLVQQGGTNKTAAANCRICLGRHRRTGAQGVTHSVGGPRLPATCAIWTTRRRFSPVYAAARRTSA
jgi:hypothetical protein